MARQWVNGRAWVQQGERASSPVTVHSTQSAVFKGPLTIIRARTLRLESLWNGAHMIGARGSGSYSRWAAVLHRYIEALLPHYSNPYLLFAKLSRSLRLSHQSVLLVLQLLLSLLVKVAFHFRIFHIPVLRSKILMLVLYMECTLSNGTTCSL